MDECNPAPTPMEIDWNPDLYPNDQDEVDAFPMREALGSLGHLANQTE
jgi:hypothetical protein